MNHQEIAELFRKVIDELNDKECVLTLLYIMGWMQGNIGNKDKDQHAQEFFKALKNAIE